MLLTFLFFAKLLCAVCLCVCVCDGTCDVSACFCLGKLICQRLCIVAMIFVYKLANKIVLLLHDVVWC